MSEDLDDMPMVVPVDEAHASLMAYARSTEGERRIANAQAEIEAGQGIEADAAYFNRLAERRANVARVKPDRDA